MIRIQIPSDHNDTIWKKQQWRKCQMTNPLSDQTSLNTNRTSPIQFQNCLYEINGMSTQQWPSTQITLLKRSCQIHKSTLWWLQLTRSEWILVYQNSFFERDFSNKKIRPKKPEMLCANLSFWLATNVKFFKISRLQQQKVAFRECSNKKCTCPLS